ncbi:unnamed protein product [Closterium sp. Naga37s-1]|nr:unnamed protein product [Closterium sp. Naga37s-1]
MLPRISWCCPASAGARMTSSPPQHSRTVTVCFRRTPCIWLARSATARMTALPGLLLVAFLLSAAIAVISITPLGRDAPIAADVSAVSPYCQHTLAPNVPLQSLSRDAIHLLVPYFAIAILALLWGMGVTHTQVRAWVHQQGLAVTAGLMKLKSASECLLEACLMQRVAVMSSMSGTHELGETLEMRMRELGVQLEETRREIRMKVGEERELAEELARVKRELAAVNGELAEHKGAVTEQNDKTRTELAREKEERRGDVQELNELRAMEELAAVNEWWPMKQDLEYEAKNSQSEGDRKNVLEAIKFASFKLDLSDCTGLGAVISKGKTARSRADGEGEGELEAMQSRRKGRGGEEAWERASKRVVREASMVGEAVAAAVVAAVAAAAVVGEVEIRANPCLTSSPLSPSHPASALTNSNCPHEEPNLSLR